MNEKARKENDHPEKKEKKKKKNVEPPSSSLKNEHRRICRLKTLITDQYFGECTVEGTSMSFVHCRLTCLPQGTYTSSDEGRTSEKRR